MPNNLEQTLRDKAIMEDPCEGPEIPKASYFLYTPHGCSDELDNNQLQ